MTGKLTEATDTGTDLEDVVYDYDHRGRLVKVTTTTWSGSNKIDDISEYIYNSSGIRVWKNVSSEIDDVARNDDVATDYLVDPANHTGYAQVLEETSTKPNNDITRISYIIGDDVIGQAKADYDDSASTWSYDDPQFILYDGHGSTRQLVDKTLDGSSNPVVTDSYSYDGYGNMLGGNPTPANPAATSHLYAGEQWDINAQHYYNRARWYNPSNGRFNRVDPFAGNMQDPQSLHKYLYAHNNPVSGVDPSGESIVGIILGAITIIGILAIILPPLVQAFKAARNLIRLNDVAWRIRNSSLDLETQEEIRRIIAKNAFLSVGSLTDAALTLGMNVSQEVLLGLVFTGFVVGTVALVKALRLLRFTKYLNFGNKLDFLFNRNINPSVPANVARAEGNAKVMQNLGILDNPENREIVEIFFNRAYNDAGSIIKQVGNRTTRQFFLPGKTHSGAIIEFVHEGDHLITIIAKGSKN